MVIRQLSVFLENQAGKLVEVTGCLCREGINIRALNVAEATDYGVLRLIVDHTDEAAEILKRQGYIFSVTQVVSCAVPDEVGGLHKLLCLLSESGFNIEYMYSVFGRDDGLAYMIFRVPNPEELEQSLKDNNVISSGKHRLGPETQE